MKKLFWFLLSLAMFVVCVQNAEAQNKKVKTLSRLNELPNKWQSWQEHADTCYRLDSTSFIAIAKGSDNVLSTAEEIAQSRACDLVRKQLKYKGTWLSGEILDRKNFQDSTGKFVSYTKFKITIRPK